MLFCDCTLEEVVDQLLSRGCGAMEIHRRDGSPSGLFDLAWSLRQASAGGSWGSREPVGEHLRPTPEWPDASPWVALVLTLGRPADGLQPLFGLTLGTGPTCRVLHASAPLRAAFPDLSSGTPAWLAKASGEGAPSEGTLGTRWVEVASRRLLWLQVRLEDGLGAFLLLDCTEQLAQGHRKALREADLLKRVLDISVEGLMVVDTEGVITLVNRSFLEIHGLSPGETEGRRVTQVIENTRMHIVAQTGVAEVDEVQEIGGHGYVVSRIPLYQDGRCLGAVGKIVFKDFHELRRLGLKVQQLKAQLEALRKVKGPQPGEPRFTFEDIPSLAESSRMIKERAMRIAPTASTVLLLGESGVGKEVYAQAIHNLSPRCSRPFVRVNCSAITETLFESELFGYDEGAFTGARKGGRAGKFERAHTGTIFLDEIGDMPLAAQAKLLRVLQEREIDRVGGAGTLPVDVRVIAATNQDLGEQVAQGRFRKDLFYRLNVIPLVIPPLRERPEDIPELARLFWEELQQAQGFQQKRLTEQAWRLIHGHAWPGNSRELRNVLERTLAIVREDLISEEQVRMVLVGVGPGDRKVAEDEVRPLAEVVEIAEKRAIGFALARTNNNRLQAAKLLGVSRPLLYRKMRQYGMM